MNRSDRFRLLFVICSFFIVVALSWRLLPHMPDSQGRGMTYDAVTSYTTCIESGHVTNWHSSLLMYECIALKHVAALVFGREFSGTGILWGVWIATTIVMAVAICLLAYTMLKKGSWWAIALPCCIAVSFKYVGDLSPVGLDYYFTCLLWCLFAVMFMHFQAGQTMFRGFYLVLIFLLLLHLVSYRKNFALSVPFVLGWLFYTMNWFREMKWKKQFAVCMAVTFALVSFSMTWVDVLFPVEKRHPLRPMMESDIRIAAVLRGEQDPYRLRGLMQSEGKPEERCISAYWVAPPESMWKESLAIYVNEWKRNPETMSAAAIIQRIQFYSGGHSFPFLKDAVESRFPAVRRNENAWNTIAPTVQSPLKRLFWLCMAPICVVLGFVCWRREIVSPEICAAVIIAGSLSTLYSLSYLVVTPTPDARYLAPAHMMSLFSLSVLSFAILETSGKWIYAKLHLR